MEKCKKNTKNARNEDLADLTQAQPELLGPFLVRPKEKEKKTKGKPNSTQPLDVRGTLLLTHAPLLLIFFFFILSWSHKLENPTPPSPPFISLTQLSFLSL